MCARVLLVASEVESSASEHRLHYSRDISVRKLSAPINFPRSQLTAVAAVGLFALLCNKYAASRVERASVVREHTIMLSVGVIIMLCC